MSIKKERDRERLNWVLEVKKSSNDNDVGINIFTERARRGVPGSIKNLPRHIWIQWSKTRRRSGVKATVRRSIRDKEVEEQKESTGIR